MTIFACVARPDWPLGAIALLLLAPSFARSAEPERPNIVLVLADDLGYGDLACYGAKDIKTPNLDRFATEGLRLTSCYAGHANCSPSRAALMTGRTPTRAGIRNWIPQDSLVHLGRKEITIATLLREKGYETCHVGKWHLNGEFNEKTQPQPNDHGFAHWFSTQNNALPNHRNPDNFVRNGRAVGELKGYSAPIIIDEATDWLTKKRDRTKPFFMYVCFHEPHEPIASDAKYTKLYPSDDPSYSAHHGNITQMDDAFGRLMKLLDDQKLRDNTFVLFTSDNGPAVTKYHPHGSAGPLRDKKGSLYEGGIRVPEIVRWPGHIKAGTVSDEPVSGVDFLPTACELASIKPPANRKLDGISVVPLFSGKELTRSVPLYWHFHRAIGVNKVALRHGDWKILATLDTEPGRTNDLTDEEERAFKAAKLQSFSLYNLKTDIGEKRDLAKDEPKKLAELKELLQPLYDEVKAESPVWPAWKFTNAEGKRIIWPDYAKPKKP